MTGLVRSMSSDTLSASAGSRALREGANGRAAAKEDNAGVHWPLSLVVSGMGEPQIEDTQSAVLVALGLFAFSRATSVEATPTPPSQSATL